MSPRASWLDRRFQVLGGSLPASIALLIGTTLTASILGAQLAGFAVAGALVPGYVFTGQVWRLVTWAFFEQDPLGLIFAALALFWFGNDLVRIWGPVRFLADTRTASREPRADPREAGLALGQTPRVEGRHALREAGAVGEGRGDASPQRRRGVLREDRTPLEVPLERLGLR